MRMMKTASSSQGDGRRELGDERREAEHWETSARH